MTARHVHRRSALLRFALAVGLASAASAQAAPQIRVTESGPGRLEIEAHDARVREVLEALRASHIIHFRTKNPLARVVTGTYSGTLPHVLSRILEGYSYFLQVSVSGTMLRIVDAVPGDKTAVVNAVTRVPNAGHAASSNVDADDEKAEAAVAGPAMKTSPPPARSGGAATSATGPVSRRVSTNVDLDEEGSQ